MATLRGLRAAAGLTQEQLAAKMLVPAARVAAWEAGRLTPMRLHVGLLALALGVARREVQAALDGMSEG